MKRLFVFYLLSAILLNQQAVAQNFTFNYNTSGRRVCLTSAQVDTINEEITIRFLDSLENTSDPIIVNKRIPGTYTWTNVATSLPAGTGHWTDTNVQAGETWEYQVKRGNTWTYESQDYDATGYTIGALLSDNSGYKGQMILLVSDDIPTNLPFRYERLKKEITADGWLVVELIVTRAADWDSGDEVVAIKNQITTIYGEAPVNDKPKVIFILGHVPLPRCGSSDVTAPDMHDQNKGARGCDSYYADMDGIYTDTATFEQDGLSTALAINLPGDYKWDQDFFPSDIEMAFGRVDFADLIDISTPELTLMSNYLDRLSQYKNVQSGFDMGDKSAFYYGYDNSNDGTYRSLPNISTPGNVFQNETGENHNQWVQENGPFNIYMQNVTTPSVSDWQTYGMDATVYSSDQSYWGFGDVPQSSGSSYGRIRALLGIESKCLVTLWTTTGINIFHQACTGQPVGIAMKEIMNHNQDNQYIEKAPQQYDTEDWWNRTHFAFYGDPTLNLYQVSPPSCPELSNMNGNALLEWTSSEDTDVIGYHIYESLTESGKYERITNHVVSGNSFIIPDYHQGHWYMVKAIKIITSGCGQFIHSGLGVSLPGDIALSNSSHKNDVDISCYPNPTKDMVYLSSPYPIKNIRTYSPMLRHLKTKYDKTRQSAVIDLSEEDEGIYILSIRFTTGQETFIKVVKTM